MLELAAMNMAEVNKIFFEQIVKEKNKYYQFDDFTFYRIKFEETDVQRIQYISKSSKGEILGYLEAKVNRYLYYVEDILTINLSDSPHLVFSRDVVAFMEILLMERNFRKIIFRVITENPIYPVYEKFLVGETKMARLVGVYKEHYRLRDGKYYDLALFEISNADFRNWMARTKKKKSEE